MDDKQAFLSLHRYFIWANRLRHYFVKAVEHRDSASENVWADELGMFMSHWYGALYVVVEGWRELGLEDPTVDTLLQSSNVELLKRFRNGTFHFQRKYFDQRFVDFWDDSKDTVDWVHELNRALGSFFLKELGKRNRDG